MRVRVNGFGRTVIAFLVVSAVLSAGTTPAGAATGGFDKTFGFDGRIVHTVGSGTLIYDGVVAADGSSYAIIFDDYPTLSTTSIRRYTARGAVDLSFAEDGRIPLGADVYVRKVALDGSKLLVLSWVDDAITGADQSSVVRYNENGSVDKTFNGGLPLISDDATIGRVSAIAVDSRHRVLLGRQTPAGGTVVSRRLAGGGIDTTFSGDGQAELLLPDAFPFLFAVTATDSLIIVGTATLQSVSAGGGDPVLEQGLYLARFKPSGAIDRRFSDDGKVTLGVGLGTTLYANSVALDSGGRMVVHAARNSPTSGISSMLLRFTRAGVLDTSFSGDGRVSLSGGPGGLAIQADDRIVIANSEDAGLTLRRFTTAGRADKTYSGDGRSELRFASRRSGGSAAIGICRNGRSLHILGAVGPRPGVLALAAVLLT